MIPRDPFRDGIGRVVEAISALEFYPATSDVVLRALDGVATLLREHARERRRYNEDMRDAQRDASDAYAMGQFDGAESARDGGW